MRCGICAGVHQKLYKIRLGGVHSKVQGSTPLCVDGRGRIETLGKKKPGHELVMAYAGSDRSKQEIRFQLGPVFEKQLKQLKQRLAFFLAALDGVEKRGVSGRAANVWVSSAGEQRASTSGINKQA
jgi:hypothetical protein